MNMKKILRITAGVLTILLGLLMVISNYSEFRVILATLLFIAGTTILYVGHTSDQAARDNTVQNAPPSKEPKNNAAAKAEMEADAFTEERGRLPKADRAAFGWFGVVALLAVFVVFQAFGTFSNWFAPEQALGEDEFLQVLGSAKIITMKGRLKSTDNFTYLYLDDKRIGTANVSGWWNMRWHFMNKGKTHYTMSYSDYTPDEDKFTVYAYTGSNSGDMGYAQTATEELQHMLYFYNAGGEPVGYVNVEPAWGFYRDEWAICNMNGETVYEVSANYNALDKQLTYTIVKQRESEINVLQAMGLRFLTDADIRNYYRD